MTRGTKFIIAVLAAPLVLASGIADLSAQSAAEFYKGKSVRMLVGASPGGGYDTSARMLARFMKGHIPGKPRLIVQNRPGASSRVAANWLYNAGPRDGTVLGAFSQTLPLAQALGQRKVKYDASLFHYIGTPIQPVSTIIAWHTAGITSLLQARDKQYIVGATSSTGANFLYPAVANHLFGTKFKIVIGYKGGSQVDLALERGEVSLRGSATWSHIKGSKKDWYDGKKVIPLVQNSLRKHPDLPNVPRFIDLAKTKEQRAVLQLLGEVAAVGRPLLTNRGVPADRVAALRKAFDDTMKNAGYLAAAKKINLEVMGIPGTELQALVRSILATPKDVLELTNAALQRKATKCTKFTKAKYCRKKKKKKRKKKKSS